MTDKKTLVLVFPVFISAPAYIFGGLYGLLVIAVIFGRALWGGD
jgi:hypothetical protein